MAIFGIAAKSNNIMQILHSLSQGKLKFAQSNCKLSVLALINPYKHYTIRWICDTNITKKIHILKFYSILIGGFGTYDVANNLKF